MTDCVDPGCLYWQSITLALRMGDWGAVATAVLPPRAAATSIACSLVGNAVAEPGRRLGPARSKPPSVASRHRYDPRRHWHAVRGYRLHRVVGLISPPVGDPARVGPVSSIRAKPFARRRFRRHEILGERCIDASSPSEFRPNHTVLRRTDCNLSRINLRPH